LLVLGSGQMLAATNPPPMVLTVEGTNVWIQRFRTQQREDAYPAQLLEVRDHGYTGPRSRATVRLSDLSVARISERSDFEILPLTAPNSDGEFSLLRGLLYLLHRDRPGSHRFTTPTATAATRGTEFTLEVDEATGETRLTVLEGEAELRNEAGVVILARGEQGVALLGQVPTKTAVIDTTNLVQWCLYYPGVLDVDELELPELERRELAASLSAWRSGDLLNAVATYPAGRAPVSEREKVYASALLLAVGQVGQAEALLGTLAPLGGGDARTARLGQALRDVISAVKVRAHAGSRANASGVLATEWLADSYRHQSLGDLSAALLAARQATGVSPEFGFAWVRVAELEFGFGRIDAASRALANGLRLAPRDAQGLALQGFLLSARNRTREAMDYFEQALAMDGGLGNAWLGRGLCKIRRGDAEGGRFDLQVAATVEPQRSLLRSYLGKAFTAGANPAKAERELELARQLDAGDPTPWLYTALLLQPQNRLNEAVRALERSQELNDNRLIYRSRLALDQDKAVRSANLANVYRDVGLTEVGAREAGRAVTSDYANDSAHLFLANSYNELRDPSRVDLRYETAWFTEYLVANLLAPVGAGGLSPAVSQQEYGRLLERDRLGFASSTEYRDNGDWTQSAVQHGTFGSFGYAAEVFYQSLNGTRPNNDLEQLEAIGTFKTALSSKDTVLLRLNQYWNETGDVNHYYRQQEANPLLRTKERYEPSVLAGYHRAWTPGSHTLALAGRIQDRFDVRNPLDQTLLFVRDFSGTIGTVVPLNYEQRYRSEFELYTGELQHILQLGKHTAVFGGRFQGGTFDTHNEQSGGVTSTGNPVGLSPNQNLQSSFDRESVYAYDHWQLWETTLLEGGLSYDRLGFPENYRYGPISDEEITRDGVFGKVGVIFTPFRSTTLRAAYAQGLGGVSLDQSYRLEPSQVAGFNQAYRSLIPESVAGANAAPLFDAWSLSLEQKFGRGTYAALGGEILSSTVRRKIGVVDFSVSPIFGPALTELQTPQELDFREHSLLFTLNQLVGDEWSFGARYRLSRAELESRFPAIPAGAAVLGGFEPTSDVDSWLHQLAFNALYQHASGFFGGASALWTAQSNHGYTPARPGDEFWQVNVELGWRFFRRRLEARVALLNVADHNYRLNPLNLTSELPRERTLAVRLQFNY
jgi:tetratricopeptide (TPR) repeat protein